jgi:hypothetical protein
VAARPSRRPPPITPSTHPPIQLSQWKWQFHDRAGELFTSGKKTKEKHEGQAKEAQLFQQIRRLQMELE